MQLATRKPRLIDGLIGGLLVVLYLTMALATLNKVGITWDEPTYFRASEVYASYFYHVLRGKEDPLDPTFIDHKWNLNHEHPVFSKTLSGLIWAIILRLNNGKLSFVQSMTAYRLSTALLTAIGVLVVYLFASKAYGRAVGIASSLALIFIPRFFAHSRYAALDVPIAVMWLLTVWAFWSGLENWKFGILSGVLFGLALNTKINAFFIPFALLPWLVVSFRDKIKFESNQMIPNFERSIKVMGRRVPTSFVTISSFFVVAPLVFFLTWPWLWHDTILRIGRYLRFHFQHFSILCYYLGKTYEMTPWHYPFVMLAITLPLPILSFSVIGALKAIHDTISLNNRTSFLILINAFVPVVIFSSPNTLGYDGIRLFMPALPFIALLAGIGVGYTIKQIRSLLKRSTGLLKGKKIDRYASVAYLFVLILLIIQGASAFITEDPYESVYYNSLVGGTNGAVNKFELEYWGQAHIEAVRWLNRYAIRNATVFSMISHLLVVYQKGWSQFISEGVLRDDIQITEDPELLATSDYIILLTRQGFFTEWQWNLFQEVQPIFSYQVDGAPIIQIYDALGISLILH